METWDTIIGHYTNAHDTLCVGCGDAFGRQDIEGYIIREGYPDGFTCVECGNKVPCDPKRCTCITETGESFFTITATGTYFVTAKNADEAQNIVYEAMLGNDKKDVLGWGEVHLGGMVVQRGTHYTIPISTEEPF